MKFSIAAILSLLASPLFAATYYVDFASGVDTNNGTSQSTPWKHCPGDANATSLAAATTPAAGSTIKFKGGVSYLGAIAVKAGGASNAQTVFDGNLANDWGSGPAIIDGSLPLTGWTACTSQNDALGNPNWQHIYKVSAPSEPDPFTFNLYAGSTFLWTAQEPNQSDPFWYDDISQYRSISQTPVQNMTTTALTDANFFTQSDSSYWNGSWVALWLNPNLVALRAITGFNPATHTISYADTSTEGTPYTDGRDEFYAIINSIHALDTAGEYYFDANSNQLFIWPIAAPPTGVTYSKLTKAFEFAGRPYLTFQGFTVQKFTGSLTDSEGGRTFSCNTDFYPNYTNGITIKNCTIQFNQSGYKRGDIDLFRVNGLTIQNCTINQNLRCNGMNVNAQNATISNNSVSRIGRVGIWAFPIITGTVSQNTISDLRGIHGNGMSGYGGCSNLTFSRNLVTQCLRPLTTEDSTAIQISNNIFIPLSGDSYVSNHGDSNYGIYYNYFSTRALMTAPTGVTLKDNVLLSRAIDGSPVTQYNFYTGAQSGLGAGEVQNVSASSIFVNPANDWRQLSDSSAIGAAIDVGVSIDFYGNARPQGGSFDIGPSEFVPSGPTPSPTPSATPTPTASLTPSDTPTPTPTPSVTPTATPTDFPTLTPTDTPTPSPTPSLTPYPTPSPSPTASPTPQAKVTTPTISPASRKFNQRLSITIVDSTVGATIHYTTDGSNPTGASVTYSGTFYIYRSCTVKAIAVKIGLLDSNVSQVKYSGWILGR